MNAEATPNLLDHARRRSPILRAQQWLLNECQLGNLPLSNAVVYDWLDEVFAWQG